MYDSNGILSLYRIHGHDLWTPVLNTKVNQGFNATSLCPRARNQGRNMLTCTCISYKAEIGKHRDEPFTLEFSAPPPRQDTVQLFLTLSVHLSFTFIGISLPLDRFENLCTSCHVVIFFIVNPDNSLTLLSFFPNESLYLTMWSILYCNIQQFYQPLVVVLVQRQYSVLFTFRDEHE